MEQIEEEMVKLVVTLRRVYGIFVHKHSDMTDSQLSNWSVYVAFEGVLIAFSELL